MHKSFSLLGYKLVRSFSPLGYKLVKSKNSNGYIPAAETVEAAKKANLSVCDYVENMWNSVGVTQKVIDKIVENGLLELKEPKILEIGPGTGRFMDKIISRINFSQYESYEIAKDWAKWLGEKYPIISHKANGVSLHQTNSETIDFLHAHGVFVYLPTIKSMAYFEEINRVCKPNSLVYFDIISESCLDKENRSKWIKSKQYYPQMLSKDLVIEIFEDFNFRLIGNYIRTIGSGTSEYLIFRKRKTNII